MLRHQGTKSKSDLRRSKSTTSVRSVGLQHLNAETAQRDAHIAAMKAFDRGVQRRTDEENYEFPPSPKKKSTELSRSNTISSQVAVYEGQPGLRHAQSVRFAGPKATRQRRYRTSIERTTASRDSGDDSMTYVSATEASPISRAVGILSPVDEGNAFPGYRNTHRETRRTYLAPTFPKLTLEDDVASMPSSYRRSRPARVASLSHRTLRDPRRGDAVRTPTYNPRHAAPDYDSLDSVPIAMTQGNIGPAHHGHASIAASMCLHSHTIKPAMPQAQTRPRGKTGSIFGSLRRAQKTIPQTLRNNSTHGSEENLEPEHSATAVHRHSSLRVRAKRASSVIKGKIRGFLASNSHEEEVTIPPQHVEAKRTHVGSARSGSQFGPCADDIFSSTVFNEGSNGVLKEIDVEDHVEASFQHQYEQRKPYSFELDRQGDTLDCTVPYDGPVYHSDAFPAVKSVINSDRVYSALMKHKNDTLQLADVVMQQRNVSSTDDSDPFWVGSSRDCSGEQPPPVPQHGTVRRHVVPESASPTEEPRRRFELSDTSDSPLDKMTEDIGAMLSLVEAGAGRRDSINVWEDTPAVFSSPDGHLFRTRSPFRKDLQRSMGTTIQGPRTMPAHMLDFRARQLCDDSESHYSPSPRRLMSTAPAWISADSKIIAADDATDPQRKQYGDPTAFVEEVQPAETGWQKRVLQQVHQSDMPSSNPGVPTSPSPAPSEFRSVIRREPVTSHIRDHAEICGDDAWTPSFSRQNAPSLAHDHTDASRPTAKTRTTASGSPIRDSPSIRMVAASAEWKHRSASASVDSPASSSPAYSAALQRQFGPVPRSLSIRQDDKENQSPSEVVNAKKSTATDNERATSNRAGQSLMDTLLGNRRQRMASDHITAFL